MENKILQGELSFIHLDPAFGREIGGYKPRPVLVVSISDIHQNTRVVTVVPKTTSPPPANRPNIVALDKSNTNKLSERTYFQCQQVRAFDQGRMTSRPLGFISRHDLDRVMEGISHCLGI